MLIQNSIHLRKHVALATGRPVRLLRSTCFEQDLHVSKTDTSASPLLDPPKHISDLPIPQHLTPPTTPNTPTTCPTCHLALSQKHPPDYLGLCNLPPPVIWPPPCPTCTSWRAVKLRSPARRRLAGPAPRRGGGKVPFLAGLRMHSFQLVLQSQMGPALDHHHQALVDGRTVLLSAGGCVFSCGHPFWGAQETAPSVVRGTQ